jgi:hypothetical protein
LIKLKKEKNTKDLSKLVKPVDFKIIESFRIFVKSSKLDVFLDESSKDETLLVYLFSDSIAWFKQTENIETQGLEFLDILNLRSTPVYFKN